MSGRSLKRRKCRFKKLLLFCKTGRPDQGAACFCLYSMMKGDVVYHSISIFSRLIFSTKVVLFIPKSAAARAFTPSPKFKACSII